jgi:inactivated superfamily I helicase
LKAADWDDAGRYAAALEEYTRPEPPALVRLLHPPRRGTGRRRAGRRDENVLLELESLRDEARRLELLSALPALEQALASF